MTYRLRCGDNPKSSEPPINKEISHDVSWEINVILDVLAEKIDRGFQTLPNRLSHILIGAL